MEDGSVAFDRAAHRRLIEKLEALMLAICRIQQHPAPDMPTRTAIVTAELARLAAAGRADGYELGRDTFDCLTVAIRDWHEHARRQR